MRAGSFRGGKEVTPEEFLNALTEALVETVRNYNEKKSMKMAEGEASETTISAPSSAIPSAPHSPKQHRQQG